MDSHARAGIDFHGSVLRYAEVERYEGRYRLLRLGSCDFDFDVTRDVLNGADEGHLETVAEALRDVFSGSVATRLHVALHPPDCYSFFTPLPAGLEGAARQARLDLEMAVLTDVTAAPQLHYRTDALYSETLQEGEAVAEWSHVLATPPVLHARFGRILKGLAQTDFSLQLSMHATAAVMGYLETRLADAPRGQRPLYSMAVGLYPTHVEYVLCRQGRWRFSHHTAPQEPVDVAYFAVQLLRRLEVAPADVAHFYLYGLDADPGAFDFLEGIFRMEAERLNPMRVVELDPSSLSSGFEAEAYAPCIGVAL